MTWTRPSIQTIYDRVKADFESYVTDGVPVPRSSMLGIIGMVIAGASHLDHGFLEWIKKQNFPDTADGYGRKRWGNIFKLPQKNPTYSTGYVAFTGTGTVDEGTVLVNSDGYEFETQDDFLIGTDVEVEAIASDAGADSNTTDTYLTISSPITDVDDAATIITVLSDGTVPTQFDNGTDLETDEAWVYRLLHRFQNPPSSGNEQDYVRWALETPGVGRAWCIPAQRWNDGTVAVFVATYDMSPVSTGILTQVGNHIDSVRPIPANLQYYNINSSNISFSISISPNNADMRDAVEEQLQQLILLETVPGGNESSGTWMRISHIRQAIMAAGVTDYVINVIGVSGYGMLDVTANIELDYPDTLKYFQTVFSDL